MTATEDLTREEVSAQMLAYRQEQLSDLLSRWDHWLHDVTVGRGYDSTSASAGLYRSSTQYDDANGAWDDRIEHATMQTVQSCMERLSGEHRIAIHVEARNLRLGLSVWQSPRLPANQREARAVIDAARLAAIVLLHSAGVIE